jgi:hypothetical protein
LQLSEAIGGVAPPGTLSLAAQSKRVSNAD